MVLVTNMPQFTPGGVGGDWKVMLAEIGLSIAENVITNYVQKKFIEAPKITANQREGRSKAWKYIVGQYRPRRRKFLQTRYLQNKYRSKGSRRRSPNY